MREQRIERDKSKHFFLHKHDQSEGSTFDCFIPLSWNKQSVSYLYNNSDNNIQKRTDLGFKVQIDIL